MVFVGTGYLYTFMKKYSFSGVGLVYLIGAFCIQWEILVEGLFVYLKGTETRNIAPGIQKIHLSIPTIINANFGALSVLISFGAVLGKANPLQLLFMAIIEICFYVLNVYVGVLTLEGKFYYNNNSE
jgi:ammonium transporter Rh